MIAIGLADMKIDIQKLKREQTELAAQVSLQNELPPLNEIKTVAGADISCGRFSKQGYAAVVVLSYPQLQFLELATAKGELTFPYIPGYLAFREAPLLLRCIEQLKTIPDVLVCDGQGIAHPRRFGIASHVGVRTGWITVGCAKSRLVGDYDEPPVEKGNCSALTLDGEPIGEVLRTRNKVKPLFISPGHRIDIPHATELVFSLCPKYRQPETTRIAHRLVNEIRVKGSVK